MHVRPLTSLTLRTLDNFNINLLHPIHTSPDESGPLLNQLTVVAPAPQLTSGLTFDNALKSYTAW